jgi:thiol-disulfide isomerase/thioredoxin
MKQTIIFMLLLTSIILSCEKDKKATIAGNISGTDNTPLLLRDGKLSYEPDTLPVINGNFSKTIDLNNAGFVYLMYGNLRKVLFLSPGYSLNISFQGTHPEKTYKIEGNGATENIVLDSISKSLEKLNYSFIYHQPLEISMHYIDSAFKSLNIQFKELIGSKQIDPVFIEYEKISLECQAASLRTIVGQRNNASDTGFYNFLNDIGLTQDKYLNVPEYREFLSTYCSLKAQKIIDKMDSAQTEKPGSYLDAVLQVIQKLENQKVKEYLFFNEINGHLKYYGVKDFSKYSTFFSRHNTDPIYAKELQKNYVKKQLLAPGKPAPGFTCADINNNQISLNDFIGKFVYIDFWATWCGPCRKELPEYMKLQADYKNKNIIFISISLDDNKKSWEKSLEENKPQCVSLVAENGWNSKVARAYQISGIPTFVLIDKSGKIIDSQAPRPSSSEIRKKLDDLLTE